MKIRTIPQEYEAIQFNGITKDVKDFLSSASTRVRKQDDYFVLSNFVGNHRLEIGDYLYKIDSPITMVSVIHNDSNTSKYFEVIE